MNALRVSFVSVSKSGDCFQICFEQDDDNYFLLQRVFEFEDCDPCYIESQINNIIYMGHGKVKTSSLFDNKFRMQFVLTSKIHEIEIEFPNQTNETLEELNEVLAIIIPDIKLNGKYFPG